MPAPRHPRATPPEDYVSRLIADWRTERPDLPVEPVAIVYRLFRLAARMGPQVERAFSSSEITSADFAVLAIVRRRAAPYRVSQKALQEALGITSGTISVRVDRLANLGFLRRDTDADDARSVVVSLTLKGEAAFDAVAPRHLNNEAALVDALNEEEQAELARLLQVLLAEFEPIDPRPGADLGLQVASAHVSRERRRAVGLEDIPGLLVEEVEPASVAERVGIRQGDLLIASGRTELRSLTCLAAAIAASRREIPLALRRGETVLSVRVPMPDASPTTRPPTHRPP